MIGLPLILIITLFVLHVHVKALDSTGCYLRALSPSLGPVDVSTLITIQVSILGNLAHNSSIVFYFNNTSATQGVFASTVPSTTDASYVSSYTVLSPLVSSTRFTTISADACAGSLLFSYYNVSGSDFTTSSSQLRVTGGSSIAVTLTQESPWTAQVSMVYAKLVSASNSSVAVYYTLTQSFPAQQFLSTNPKRYFVTTDATLGAIGAGTAALLYLSLNGQNFVATSYLLHIAASSPYNIMFLYDNFVTDLGWNAAHNAAKMIVASYFGPSTNIDFIESPSVYDPDAHVVEKLAATGRYNMIIICTDYSPYDFAFLFPDVTFLIRSMPGALDRPDGIASNIIFYNAQLYTSRYLAGVVAAEMIPPGGKACFLNCYLCTECLVEINAARQGILKYNPTAQFRLLTIESYDDFFLESGAAAQLYSEGCDLMMQNTNHPQAMTAFTAGGRYAIGAFSDSRSILGENMLTASETVWTPIYFHAIQAALDGNLSSAPIVRGYSDKAVALAPFSGRLTAAALAAFKKEEQALLAAGELNYMLCGPLYDNTGVLQIPAGRCANYTDLVNMLWEVQGITDIGVYSPVPPAHDDTGLKGPVPIIYFAIVAATYAVGLFFLGFLWAYRSDGSIKFSQPRYIATSIFGSMIGISSIYPLSKYASISDAMAYKLQKGLNTQAFPDIDQACQAVPWLLVCGFVLIYPVLFTKLYRQHLTLMLALEMRKEKVSFWRVAPYATVASIALLLPLVVWQSTDPLRWKVDITGSNTYGSPITSVGFCSSNNGLQFMATLACVAAVVQMVGYYVCDISQNDEDVNHDSQKVFYSMCTFVIVSCVGAPIVFLVYNAPQSKFAILSTIIVIAYGSSMFIVCLPKVLDIWFPRSKEFIVRPEHVNKVKSAGPPPPVPGGSGSNNAASSVLNGVGGVSAAFGSSILHRHSKEGKDVPPRSNKKAVHPMAVVGSEMRGSELAHESSRTN